MFGFEALIGPQSLWIIFLLVILEGNPFIGSFIPGQVLIVILAAFYAATGSMNPLYVTAVVFIGALLGDILGYYLGSKSKGSKLMNKCGLHENSLLYKTSCSFFQKYGPLSLILGREFNVTRAFIPFFAGMSDMKKKTFFIYATISCLVWAMISVYLGYYFGYAIVDKLEFLFAFLIFLIFYIAILIVIYRFFANLYKTHTSFIKEYALHNIFYLLIFFILITTALIAKLKGFDAIINDYGSLFVFNDIFIFSILFSKVFMLLLFEAIFLAPLFLKKIRLFIVFFWSSFLYFQIIFIMSLLIKSLVDIQLYLSLLLYTLATFFGMLFIVESRIKENVKNKLYIILLVSLFIVTLLRASYEGSDLFTSLLTLLIASMGCELLYILSHFKLLDSYLSESLQKL